MEGGAASCCDSRKKMMDVNTLIALEDIFIYQDAVGFPRSAGSSVSASQSSFSVIGEDISEIAHRVHHKLLLKLISIYVSAKFSNADNILRICFDTSAINSSDLYVTRIESIPSICEELHISFLNSKFTLDSESSKVRKKSKEQLIELGAVYTQSHIAKSIVDDTFANLSVPVENAKVLDFACGTGRFYENVIAGFENKRQAVLANVYAIDIDTDALFITRLKALSFLDAISDAECVTLCRHIAVKDGLRDHRSLFSAPTHSASNEAGALTDGVFDAIVSNPPYLVLKPNKAKAGMSGADKIREQVTYYRTCGVYQYAIEGMLNLYQLSIERMLQLLKPGGVLGIICPSTLFGDVSARKLRRHLLLMNDVRSIRFFAEKIPLFENVSQATNIFILQKGGMSSNISITEDDEAFEVPLSVVQELFPENLEIPAIKSIEWNILRKLASMKKLKQIPAIRNRRGELDLTLCKKFITTDKTPYRLVRGNMVGISEIKDINGEYVRESFIATRSNDFRTLDFNHKRLVCQQISNRGLRRRLKFVYCSASDILGNSCNYISSDEDTLARLYLVLNSSVLNWRFKITSSNNHINNYELDELPIPELNKIDPGFAYSTQEELDEYVGSLYGLSREERNLIKL